MKKRKWIERRCSGSSKKRTRQLLFAALTILIVHLVLDYSGISTAYAGCAVHYYGPNGICTSCDAYEPAEKLTSGRCSELGISTKYIDYYAISNGGQLSWFSLLVNGKLNNINKNPAANAILLKDIVTVKTQRNWYTPMGTETGPYTGTFDGNKHTVKLDIYDNAYHQGLFSIVGDGATIKNVGVAGSITGGAYSAGLIGSCNTTGTLTISNCWNEAIVKSNFQTAAGILGCNMNSAATVIIKNCYNVGNIKGEKESAAICGWLGNNAIVENCYNMGKVEGAESGKTFARYNSATLKNCYQLDTVGTQNSVTAIEEGKFRSGEVCYLLNGEDAKDATRVWYQNVDNGQPEDEYPKHRGGTVYKDYQTYTNQKSETAIEAIEGGISKIYDGTAFILSAIKGTHFTWDGRGTAKIIGYYMDSRGTTMTNKIDSGASSDGGAPVNAGRYYAKVTITGNDNFLATTGYVPFQILDKDIVNRLNNPGGETVIYDSSNNTTDGSLNHNGWSGDSQMGSYHGLEDYALVIGINKQYHGGYDASPVLGVVPHGGTYYMGNGVAMNLYGASVQYSCYQDVDISEEATDIDAGKRVFNLSGWLCATGGNTATISLKELDENKNVVATVTHEKSVNADAWTKVTLSGAVLPKVRYLQVTITSSHNNYGIAAFDDLSLYVLSNEDVPPFIETVPEQTMVSGKTLGPLSFSVSDIDNAFSSLTITATSSNQSLVPASNITVKLANNNGIIKLTSASGQVGKATITVAVSDGSKKTIMSFQVIVNPDLQMDTNLVVTGEGLYGWIVTEGKLTKGKAPDTGEEVYLNSASTASYMYQDINLGKFSALIDVGLLNYTASGNIYGNGSIKLIFYDHNGYIISEGGVGIGVSIPSGTRTLRVEIGGPQGCMIGSVSFKINSAELPKTTPINDQSINSGSSTDAIPFIVGYAESSADTVISAVSSDTTVVPNSAITFGGSEYQRTVKVTPPSNVSGSATITILVNKKEAASFLVTVIPPITGLTVQPGSVSVTSGYVDAPKLSVTVQKAEGMDESTSITYQWYHGDGTSIKDAISESYTVPIGLSVGDYSYYCEATCGWYVKKSEMITVTVLKPIAEITIAEGYTSYEKKIGEEPFTLSNITFVGDGKLSYTSSNEGIVTVDTSGTVIIVGEGTAVITVSMVETDNYSGAESKTINIVVSLQGSDPEPQSKCPASYYGVQTRKTGGTVDLRLIAIIKTLEPTEVGFVYSASDKQPAIDKSGCTSLPSNKVYSKITVNGEVKEAVKLFGEKAYFIVGTVNNLATITTDQLYVRVYVKNAEGITYSEVKELKISTLK